MSPTDSQASILVVDDEPRVLEALRATLEGRGYEVRTAAGGQRALEMINADRPDVLLLDLAMPDLDGVTVCERLRRWTRMPIIVLSARTDEGDKVRALDAGADDYLTKPFGTEELLARIRAALRREQARREDAPVVTAGDLVIDLSARRVTRGGEEARLTPTEFSLLRELAMNADLVLTHQHLLRTVFGPGYEDATANLRVFIAQLRRKIEADPSRPRYLVTEPGIGYRFRIV
jgi:two-component system KDP operon response regulator KdpE